MASVRNVTLDDEALEDEVLDDGGVTVDGILVAENLFRALLLGLGISGKLSELCFASTPGRQTDEVITTHLVAGSGIIVVVFRVVAIPGAPERVVEALARTRRSLCRHSCSQFGNPLLLNQEACSSERNQRDCVGLSACLHAVVR